MWCRCYYPPQEPVAQFCSGEVYDVEFPSFNTHTHTLNDNQTGCTFTDIYQTFLHHTMSVLP